jgi:hypothetical protein
LVSDVLLDASKRNGIVLDSFGGSGTTVVAAEKTGRRGFLMELDPAYVDVAVRRFEKLTGVKAIHADTGLSFADVERRRLDTSSSDDQINNIGIVPSRVIPPTKRRKAIQHYRRGNRITRADSDLGSNQQLIGPPKSHSVKGSFHTRRNDGKKT